MTMTSVLSAFARQSLERYDRLLARWQPPRWLGLLLLVAVLGGSWISARDLEIRFSDVDLGPVLVACAIGVALVGLNASEYAVVSHIAGYRPGFSESWRVACISAIANLIPLPAGAAYRVHSVRTSGGSGKVAAMATVSMSMAWLGLASVVVASFLLTTNSPSVMIGTSVGLVGLLLLVTAAVLLPSDQRTARTFGSILLIESGFIAQAITRVLLVAAALQIPLNPSQAAFFAATSALSSAIGILPGGVGLWEALTAAASPLFGLSAAAGFLIAGTVRLTNIVAYGASWMGWVAFNTFRSRPGVPRK
jgi:hypothetical protein